MWRGASRCTWMQSNREGEYAKVYEVRIPMGGLSETDPSHLPCWNASPVLFLSLTLEGLRLVHTRAVHSRKTWTLGERVSVSDTGFNRTEREGTRSERNMSPILSRLLVALAPISPADYRAATPIPRIATREISETCTVSKQLRNTANGSRSGPMGSRWNDYRRNDGVFRIIGSVEPNFRTCETSGNETIVKYASLLKQIF